MKPGLSRRHLVWLACLLLVAGALVALPLALHPGGSFQGSDDRAAEAIAALGAPAQPWFHPLWQPGSEDLKNALFAFQAALGLALVGVFFAVMKRRQRQE